MSKRFLTPPNLPSGATLPLSGIAGDLFFKSDEAKIYVHNGVEWVIAQGSGGGGGGVVVSDTPPATPTQGTYWFDSTTTKSYIYYDSSWVEVGYSSSGYILSETAPVNPSEGDVWFNTAEGILYVYYDNFWVDPSAGSSKADVGHTHAITDVTNLEVELSTKADTDSPILSGEITIQNGFDSADTDIASVVGSGTDTGGLIRTSEGGHLVIALRENGSTDAFSIISGGGNWAAETIFDTLVAKFQADGTVVIPGIIQGGTKFTSVSGSRAVAADDSGKTLRYTGATGGTFTLDAGIPAGHRIDVIQDGAGQVTFAQGSGVTIKSTKGTAPKTTGQYSAATILAFSTTEYYVIGDIS